MVLGNANRETSQGWVSTSFFCCFLELPPASGQTGGKVAQILQRRMRHPGDQKLRSVVFTPVSASGCGNTHRPVQCRRPRPRELPTGFPSASPLPTETFPLLSSPEQVTKLFLRADPTARKDPSSPGVAELRWGRATGGLILRSPLRENPQQLPRAEGRAWKQRPRSTYGMGNLWPDPGLGTRGERLGRGIIVPPAPPPCSQPRGLPHAVPCPL